MNNVVEKLSEAKAIYFLILNGENLMLSTRDEMLRRAWKLGSILSEIKEEVGHGKWLFWLGGHWPELGERNARRCIAFFSANEHCKNLKTAESRGFELESVRKFMWGYLPAKERLQLEGDENIKPGAHHLTFVNAFSKWDRQFRNGSVENLDLETFKREIEPMIERIIEICDRGWFEEHFL
jgi:hypothetical protein